MDNNFFFPNINIANNNNKTSNKPICAVCLSPDNASNHFGGVVCLSCCAFFRRSVTLKMLYTCVQNQNCVVHHNLRMLCRSCRYQKCLDSNLQPKLVQKPRSKTLLGKRNKKEKSTCPEEVKISPIKDEILYPEINTPQSCPSTSDQYILSSPENTSSLSSTREERSHSCNSSQSNDFALPKNDNLLDFFVNEFKKAQKKRKLEYGLCSLDKVFDDFHDPIPFSKADIVEYNFKSLGQNVKLDHMLTFDHILNLKQMYPTLSKEDCNILFKYAFLSFSNMDHAYVTIATKSHEDGLLVFTNKASISVRDKSVGWGPEEGLTSKQKEDFIMPTNIEFFNNVIIPLADMMITTTIDITEFSALRALTICSMSRCEVSEEAKACLAHIKNNIFKGLGEYYKNKDIPQERIGELVLFIPNFVEIFRSFLDAFTKIQFFNLLEVGDEIKNSIELGKIVVGQVKENKGY